MGFFSGIADAIGSAVGAISSPISSLVGSGLEFAGGQAANSASAASVREQMAFQRDQNQRAMDFAKEMSSTSYQRVVSDLRRAGLNPALAYGQGGESAPAGVTSSGASYQAQNPVPRGFMSTAASAATQWEQAKQLTAQTEKTLAETRNADAMTANIVADTRKKTLEGDTESYRPQNVAESSRQARGAAELSESQRRQVDLTMDAVLEKLKADAAQSASSASQLNSQNVLLKAMQADPELAKYAPAAEFLEKALPNLSIRKHILSKPK